MSDHERAFDAAVQDLGGRLDLAKVAPHASAGFQRQIDRANAFIASAHASIPNMPPVYYGLIANSTFQAWAFPAEGHYCIGIHAGAIAVLNLLFSRMLSHPEIFPNIGNAPQEVGGGRSLLASFSPEDILNGVPVDTPRDHDRRLLASLLQDIACDFLTCHEFTHIANGHLDYWGHTHPSPFMPEFGVVPADAEEAKELQTLEMNADAMSVCNIAGTIRAKCTNPDKTPLGKWSQFFTSLEESSVYFSFAVNAFFALFGHLTIDDSELDSSSHPPFYQRFKMALTTASTYAHTRWGKEEATALSKGMADGWIQLERAISVLTGQPVPKEAMRNLLDVDLSYPLSLTTYWTNELREKLLPFAKGNLPD